MSVLSNMMCYFYGIIITWAREHLFTI